MYLISDNDAQWIKHSRDFDLHIKPVRKNSVIFKKTFTSTNPIPRAVLLIRSFKFSKVFLDGEQIYQSSENPKYWKTKNVIGITNISAGEHVISVVVTNFGAPPALLAYSSQLGISTDSSWLSSDDKVKWTNSALAGQKQVSSFTKQFPPSYSVFIQTLPYGLSIFLLVASIQIFYYKQILPNFFYTNHSTPIYSLRWLLIILWAALSIISIVNHPLSGGDLPDHLAYIHFIIQEGTLPVATDGGIQAFQSPLYYMIAAALLKIFLYLFDAETSYQLLKIINLLCGLTIIEICYRTVIYVFPGKVYLQFIGLLTGALFPMNLYNNQYIGNEQLAATFTALIILLVFKAISNNNITRSSRYNILLGIIFGLGLLTKVSVSLLIPPSLLMLGYISYKLDYDHKRTAKYLTIIIGMIILVSSWYYIRNWILLGKPFVGGWDPEIGIAWWQDPGYRSVQQFTRFGTALFYPIYGASAGFWDALYSTLWVDEGLGGNLHYISRPHWNYSFMLSLPLLSIIPTAAIVTGITTSIIKHKGQFNLYMIYAFSCVFIYFFAIFIFFLQVPIHSAGKSVYAMGLIPCFAILCAKGIELLTPGTLSRIIVAGFLVWWAVYSYIAFLPLDYQGRYSQFYLLS
jgi:hypothetical protein